MMLLQMHIRFAAILHYVASNRSRQETYSSRKSEQWDRSCNARLSPTPWTFHASNSVMKMSCFTPHLLSSSTAVALQQQHRKEVFIKTLCVSGAELTFCGWKGITSTLASSMHCRLNGIFIHGLQALERENNPCSTAVWHIYLISLWSSTLSYSLKWTTS